MASGGGGGSGSSSNTMAFLGSSFEESSCIMGWPKFMGGWLFCQVHIYNKTHCSNSITKMIWKLLSLLFSWFFVGSRLWWPSYRFIKLRNFTGASTGRFERWRWIWSPKAWFLLFCCLPSFHVFLHRRLWLSICGR